MKQLSNAELKMVIGGKITSCYATAECYGGGTKSCSGYSVGSAADVMLQMQAMVARMVKCHVHSLT